MEKRLLWARMWVIPTVIDPLFLFREVEFHLYFFGQLLQVFVQNGVFLYLYIQINADSFEIMIIAKNHRNSFITLNKRIQKTAKFSK